MTENILQTSLLDFLHALGSRANEIYLGGGFGLYLKQLYLANKNQRTLIDAQFWPAPRATQDIDLMLPVEIIADAQAMQSVRTALDQLHYTVVAGSEYLQFTQNISGTKAVKIDLLTAQLDTLQANSKIQADLRRARPRKSNHPKLHAHPTDGALALTNTPFVLTINGQLSNGQPYATNVKIPHPFTYLLMKLTAYRDRRYDINKDLKRHHALDIFRIVAMLNEKEAEQVHSSIRHFAKNHQVRSCARLVQSDFNSSTANGVLAMREHPLWRNDEQLEVFIEMLYSIFNNSN